MLLVFTLDDLTPKSIYVIVDIDDIDESRICVNRAATSHSSFSAFRWNSSSKLVHMSAMEGDCCSLLVYAAEIKGKPGSFLGSFNSVLS